MGGRMQPWVGIEGRQAALENPALKSRPEQAKGELGRLVFVRKEVNCALPKEALLV